MNSDRQEFHHRRVYGVVAFLGSLVLLLAGVWILLMPTTGSERFQAQAAAALALGSFVALLPLVIPRLISTRPALVLTSRGLLVSLMVGAVFVPWEDVAGFRLVRLSPYPSRLVFLAVDVHDPAVYRKQRALSGRMLAPANEWLLESPVYLRCDQLEVHPQELLSICEHSRAQYSESGCVEHAHPADSAP